MSTVARSPTFLERAYNFSSGVENFLCLANMNCRSSLIEIGACWMLEKAYCDSHPEFPSTRFCVMDTALEDMIKVNVYVLGFMAVTVATRYVLGNRLNRES